MEFRDRNGEWPWNPKVVCVSFMLQGAKRSGMLSGEELLSVARLLTLANVTREILAKSREQYPAFEPPFRRFRDFSGEI
ncbi:MAG: hypothetical protein PHV21_07875, partial [Synergistaceae bacterium]|nr:hypothetical protein [Synergistaceae bacterium]